MLRTRTDTSLWIPKQSLHLAEQPVRDAVIASLSAFPRYQVIEMAKNQVSPNGVVFAFVFFDDDDVR